MLRKIEKALIFPLRDVVSRVSPLACTRLMTWWYRRHGMRILGQPNFLAGEVTVDGTDYANIELGEGCTITEGVCFLTHDWSPYTIGRAAGLPLPEPIGVFRTIRVGRYAFVGVRTILMPGADVGEGALIGAGCVIRGKVPPWTIMVGNPAQPAGDSREFLLKNLRRMGRNDLAEQVEKALAAARNQAAAPTGEP